MLGTPFRGELTFALCALFFVASLYVWFCSGLLGFANCWLDTNFAPRCNSFGLSLFVIPLVSTFVFRFGVRKYLYEKEAVCVQSYVCREYSRIGGTTLSLARVATN